MSTFSQCVARFALLPALCFGAGCGGEDGVDPGPFSETWSVAAEDATGTVVVSDTRVEASLQNGDDTAKLVLEYGDDSAVTLSWTVDGETTTFRGDRSSRESLRLGVTRAAFGGKWAFAGRPQGDSADTTLSVTLREDTARFDCGGACNDGEPVWFDGKRTSAAESSFGEIGGNWEATSPDLEAPARVTVLGHTVTVTVDGEDQLKVTWDEATATATGTLLHNDTAFTARRR